MAAPRDLAEAVAVVAAAAPDVDLTGAVAVHGGWDSFVLDTGEWIFRFPRRPEVERTLRSEVALLPLLRTAVPLEVPDPVHVAAAPVAFVGYRKIYGERLHPELQGAAAGRDLGGFLAALHAFPVEAALSAGVPGGDVSWWRARQEAIVAALEASVAPLLPSRERETAHRAFRAFLDDDANFAFEPALVHYDLGPTHVLARPDGRLHGVIDWADAAVGDPAVDLAWALHGARPELAAAVGATYPGASAAVVDRALHYHRLGPWHEVAHGQETNDDAWIATGLAGVVERLPREPGAAR